MYPYYSAAPSPYSTAYAPVYPTPYPTVPYSYPPPSVPLALTSTSPPLDQHENLPFYTSGDVPVDPTCYNFPGLVLLPNTYNLDFSGSNKLAFNLQPIKGSTSIFTQWLSTGFYAIPGKQVQISIVTDLKENDKKEGFNENCWLQIGCHSDGLHRFEKSKLLRPPVIRLGTKLGANGQAALANPFGGLIYLEIPSIDLKSDSDSDPKKIQKTLALTLTISGGRVRTPHFKLGQTSPMDWINWIRNEPGLFAELESTKIIISVPSSSVRGLNNPAEVLQFWDGVLDAFRDLLVKPRERERPERFCTDIQISAGDMHSGYPVMAPLDMAPRFLDVQKLYEEGHWGFFHELGHNHQDGLWTFEGTGEVTVNLFGMYVHEVHLRIPLTRTEHADHFFPQGLSKDTRTYLNSKKDFENVWRQTPDLALVVYYQLVMRFSWEAYKAVFASYNQLDPRMEPKTDQDKIELWIYFFSEAVKENLVDFFKSWNFPIVGKDLKSGEMTLKMNPNFPRCKMKMEDLLKGGSDESECGTGCGPECCAIFQRLQTG